MRGCSFISEVTKCFVLLQASLLSVGRSPSDQNSVIEAREGVWNHLPMKGFS